MKKVNLLWLALVSMAFTTSCTSYDDTDGDWERVGVFGGFERVCPVSFTDPLNGNVYIGMGYNSSDSRPDELHMRDFWIFNGNEWRRPQGGRTVTVRVSPYTGRDSVVKAVLTGQDSAVTWTQNTADFPARGRKGSVAFVLGRKAYVGAGQQVVYRGNSEVAYFSDFFVFDLEKEEWEFDDAKGEFTRYSIQEDTGLDGERCAFAFGVGFSFNGKGYVGTGELKGGTTSTFFVFDTITKKWTPDNSYPGDDCKGASILDFGDAVYVCLGEGGSGLSRTVSYLDETGWHKATSLNPDLPGAWNEEYDNILRSFAQSFVSDKDPNRHRKIGYIVGGTGSNSDNWQYDRLRDRWEKTNRFSSNMSSLRVGGVGFSYGGYGYVTLGGSNTTSSSSDRTVWKFYPGIEAEDWNDY